MSGMRSRARRPLVRGLLLIATLVGGPSAQAQFSSGNDAEAERLAEEGVAALGREWNAAAFEETVRLYTAVHRAVPWPGVLEPETFAYGTAAQQTLRVFRPEAGFSEPGPVVLFIHGNGLGEQSAVVPASDGLLYDHMGKLGAAVGGIGIVMNYRTGDAATTESGATDLRLALAWIQEHVAPWGGDVNTVVLIANSEGATLAASYLFDESAQLESGPGIAAAVLASGLFIDAGPRIIRLIQRYEGTRVPLALWTAGYDAGNVQAGIAEIFSALCSKYEDCPRFEQLHGHNHVSAVLSLGTGEPTVQGALIGFYHTVR